MPTPNALPDTAVKRFRADFARVTGDAVGTVCIAVSGGADSLALLLLADAAFPGSVIAATVDHGLRAESAAEAEHVRSICRTLDVEHRIVRITLGAGGNLQARARAARYGALFDHARTVGTSWLATGHHADDQLETMLMRLNRSSGVGGLAGIRERDGILVRPLLHWRRDELLGVVHRRGILPVSDPSNEDDRFDRARMRKVISQAAGLDALAAARSAAALADADVALTHYAAETFAAVATIAGRSVELSVAGIRRLPREISRRILLLTVHHLAPGTPVKEAALQRVLDALGTQDAAMIGTVVFRTAGRLSVAALAPPRAIRA